MPKVSIILTSYNHENYIRESIDSALNQSFTDFELIIIDDASSDSSWKIISSYTDPRIKIYRNEINRYATHLLNKTITEIATSEYIAIHHSDDVWEKTKLDKQIKFLDSYPEYGAVFTNALAIGEDSNLLKESEHFYFNIFNQSNKNSYQWLNHFFYHGNALCHPSVLIRKQCYNDCGVYRYGLAQLPDFDMWIRLCLKYEIYILPDKLVRFRVRDNEANASGNRPETRVRHATEFNYLLRSFLKIETFKKMSAIFPNAKQYYRENGFEPKFVLAMIALDNMSPHWTKFFGIDLLFELIGDKDKAEKIKSLYDFDQLNLIKLTGKYDIFSVEIEAERNQLQSEIKNLKNSISWKITTPLRRINRLINHLFKD